MFNKKTHKIIGVNDTPLMLIGVPLLAFILPILFLGLRPNEGWACFKDTWIFSLLFTAMFWLGDRSIFLYFRRKFPSHHDNKKRILKSIFFIIIYTLIGTVFMKTMMHYAPTDMLIPFREKSFLRSLIPTLFATATVIAIYEALYYFAQWKNALTTAERLKKENSIAQLETLKNQVNPHFLFNSLNTLASLIPEDQDKAVQFVHNLSHVYRNVLDIKEKQIITVQEELNCIERYIFLLETRFGESIRIHLSIPEEYRSHYMVPLALQILIENAIKHNVASVKKPLTIEIFVDGEGQLVVKNNLQQKQQNTTGTQTGLENINVRCQMIMNRSVTIEKTEEHFIVFLPIIPIQTL